jgi:hypothetical protein
MVKIHCILHVWGDWFSPTKTEKRTGLRFTAKRERGQISDLGVYRGRPLPYGDASLDYGEVVDCSDPVFLEWLSQIKHAIPEFRDAGAEKIELDFLVAYKYQCNLDAESDFFIALGQLGIPVTMSCWVDESLPEPEIIIVE